MCVNAFSPSETKKRCHGYKTVSHAATFLTGFPPMELLASMHAEVYQRELREGEFRVLDRTRALAKLQAWQTLMAGWSVYLAYPGTPGQKPSAPVCNNG